MILAASSLAASGFYAKLAMRFIDPYLAVTSRFLLPAVLTALLLRGRLREFRVRELRLSISRSLALCLAQLFLYFAMERGSLAQATILYNTGPVFITAWSCLSRRRLSTPRLVALSLGFLGVCVMNYTSQAAATPVVVFGVLAAFFQAASQILLHRASKQMDTTLLMLYTYIVGSLAWLGFLGVTAHPLAVKNSAEPLALGAWLLLSALGSMGNQQFRAEAYRRVDDPATLSPLIYVSVAVAAGLDWLIFHNVLSAGQWVGGALILLGAFVSTQDKD